MSKLSHINARGEAHMVDVSDKEATHRTARAEGYVYLADATLDLVVSGEAKKGDVLATARIAGIMAAKRTSDLIPLCHPLNVSKVEVTFDVLRSPSRIKVASFVKVTGTTGVEMEALSAVSVACLTVYDMLKAAEKGMRIGDMRLVHKSGGRRGDYDAATDGVRDIPSGQRDVKG